VGKSDDKERAARLGKAMAHPLRARVLALVHESGPISGVSIARDHGLGDLPNVSYHVTVLEQLEAVKLTEKRPTEGASEYLYETTPFGEELLREIRKSDRGDEAAP
jgi:DNA-binding transcriptional ArsR family regulator